MRWARGSGVDLWLAVLAGLAGGLALAGYGCEEQPGPGSDAALDASLDVDACEGVDAGRPDAEVIRPGPLSVAQYDFCGEPFFQLPIGGPEEDVSTGVYLWGGRLGYARGPRPSTGVWDVYMLDLGLCREYRLTEGLNAVTAYIRGSSVLYEDGYYQPEPNYHCWDLYRYDLETWLPEKLTDDPMCENRPKGNGRFIAFERATTTEGLGGPVENLLWNLQTGEVTQYAPPEALAGNYDISDRYLAWTGYTELVGSLGKDVYYMDLETGEQIHVPRSAEYYCYRVRVWGEYMTYNCSEYWTSHPYHLFLRHIPTGQEVQLDDPAVDDHGIMVGVIYKNLVIWNTSRFMQDVGPFEYRSDIELYDIQTGVRRRLTSGASLLAAWRLYLPFLFSGMEIPPYGERVFRFYIANLESLGVVDATGNLIPGDPVIDPPEP